MVMNAGKDRLAQADQEQLPKEKIDKTKEPVITPQEEERNLELKRKRLQDVTEYEDLEEGPAKKPSLLNIARSDRYLLPGVPNQF